MFWVLAILAGFAIVVFLVAAAIVVVREVNEVTEVEAAPGYAVPEAREFVITRLPDQTLRRMRRSEVERLVRYCLGLLDQAGVALTSRRPGGDELEGADLVLDVAGLARAMRDGTTVEVSEEDLEEVAGAFLEYLAAIGAVGEPTDEETEER
jgi:hypothetical protein